MLFQYLKKQKINRCKEIIKIFQINLNIIIQENSVASDECYAFTFNSDINILVVGFHEQIAIYEFNNGKISKELQRLNGHDDIVFCLYFMKKSNSFVSGSVDCSIIIWELNQNNQYIAKQTLKDHKNMVNCLLMNKNANLLISGSDDETIKFWKVQNGSWECVQTTETKNYVYCLSLNEMENKLISCGNGSYILVYEIQQNDQQWVLIQTIQTNELGLRLCFTIGDQFVFQAKNTHFLEIFDYDHLQERFYKKKQVQIQSCVDYNVDFPCQFIQNFNILTVKNGNYLNIFRFSYNCDYQLIQTLEYKDFLQKGE